MPVSSPPPLFRFTFRQFAEPVVGLQVAPLPLLQSPPWPVIAGASEKDTKLPMLAKKATMSTSEIPASFLNKEHGMAASGIHPTLWQQETFHPQAKKQECIQIPFILNFDKDAPVPKSI
jgi:hypothetical protein